MCMVLVVLEKDHFEAQGSLRETWCFRDWFGYIVSNLEDLITGMSSKNSIGGTIDIDSDTDLKSFIEKLDAFKSKLSKLLKEPECCYWDGYMMHERACKYIKPFLDACISLVQIRIDFIAEISRAVRVVIDMSGGSAENTMLEVISEMPTRLKSEGLKLVKNTLKQPLVSNIARDYVERQEKTQKRKQQEKRGRGPKQRKLRIEQAYQNALNRVLNRIENECDFRQNGCAVRVIKMRFKTRLALRQP